MITDSLPWIAVALALVALIVPDGTKALPSAASPDGEARGDRRAGRWSATAFALPIVLALLALAAGWFAKERHASIWPSTLAITAGVLLACICSLLSATKIGERSRLTAPLGLALGASGIVSLVQPPDLEPARIGLAVGLAIGAWILDVGVATSEWASRAAAFGVAVALTDFLGQRAPGASSDDAGLMLAIAAVAILVAVGVARFQAQPDTPALRGGWLLSFAALMIAAGWLVAVRYLWIQHVWRVFGAAVALAYLIHLSSWRESERTSLRLALATAAWVGAGTLAFAYLQGFGMSLALLAGVTVFLAAGNRAMLLSLGPLAALVAYRAFRESHLSASRALDLGQHYALVGLLAGAVVVVAALEYRRALPAESSLRTTLGNALVAVLALGAPTMAMALLAEKGTVGLLVGLGVGVFVAALQGEDRPVAFALPAGLSLGMVTTFDVGEGLLGFARSEKLAFLYWSLPPILVLVVVLMLLIRQRPASATLGSGQTHEGATT